MAPPEIQRINIELIVDTANGVVIAFNMPDVVLADMSVMATYFRQLAETASKMKSPTTNPMELN